MSRDFQYHFDCKEDCYFGKCVYVDGKHLPFWISRDNDELDNDALEKKELIDTIQYLSKRLGDENANFEHVCEAIQVYSFLLKVMGNQKLMHMKYE